MASSFTFQGVSSEAFGLRYAPETRDTYVWTPTSAAVHEQKFDGHSGGYFYGATHQPKDFTLKCYFEENHLKDGLLTHVANFYRVGAQGRLTFSRRPWIYYNVVVVSYDDSGITNIENGIVIIKMRAYYPYGRTDLTKMVGDDYPQKYAVWQNTGFTTNMSTLGNTGSTLSGNGYLFNAGTAYADVAVTVHSLGSGNQAVITNVTTGQSCKVTDTGITCDSMNGSVYYTNNHNSAALYHDLGFIQLAPGIKYRNPTVMSYEIEARTGNKAFIYGWFPEGITNDYLRINGGEAYRIDARTDSGVTIAGYSGQSGHVGDCTVLQRNYITVTSGASVSFAYAHTFM